MPKRVFLWGGFCGVKPKNICHPVNVLAFIFDAFWPITIWSLRRLMRPKILFFSLLLFIVSILSSCAIFGGGETGLKRASDYHLDVPADWERLKSKGETDKAFRLPSGNAVTVISSCKTRRGGNLKVLSQQLLIGTRNKKILQEKPFEVSGGSGLFSSVKATLDGKRVYLGLVVIKERGCVFDFTLMSSSPLPQEELDEFLTFAKTLEYESN